MSDIKDIENIIENEKLFLSKLEVEYQENSKKASDEIKKIIDDSNVIERLDEITKYINDRLSSDDNWNGKPFNGSFSYEISPDKDTYIRLKELDKDKRLKGKPSNTSVSANFVYVAQKESTFWRRGKVAFIVDIILCIYNDGFIDESKWAYNFDGRMGGLNEKEFWKGFKKDIAKRYS